MQTFLQHVSSQLLNKNLSGNDSLIFPNKRSAGLCKQLLVEQSSHTIFLPRFLTIEELVTELSGLSMVDPLELKFIFYKHYRELYREDESVDAVFSWANQLINDFNEIDRNLVDQNDILSYLKAIKEIEHWSKTDQPTEMIKNYIRFWDKLPDLYNSFKDDLINKGEVYQGLAYRKAVDHLADTINDHKGGFYFVGFNALNKAEEKLIQLILDEGKGEAFWDIDEYFLNKDHNASYFLRQYQKKWKVLQNEKHKIEPSTQAFSEDKNFSVYSNQGNVQQAKAVGEIVDRLNYDEIKDTAILLGEESILESLMYAIPDKVKHINITMGLSLNKTSIAAFFMNYVKLCKAERNTFFYKDLLLLLEGGFLLQLFGEDCKKVRETITQEQLFFLSLEDIEEVIKTTSPGFKKIIALLFNTIPDEAKSLNEKNDLLLANLVSYAQSDFIKTLINKARSAFEMIQHYLENYQFEIGLSAYQNLYQEVISQHQIDLRGEKDKGLQIMGLLESRCLDFNNVIITSVNEGILPQGKTSSSFIPFDLKKQYQLPTYQEKDKVYSYHFFRVLQRAKNIHLLYNDLSGNLSFAEESRFIKILEEDQLDKHWFQRFNAEVSVRPNEIQDTVTNSTHIQKTLERWMTEKGISASALISYVRNPYDLYKMKVLQVYDPNELKDLESPDLFGNVVHDSLEELYNKLPLHQVITVDDMRTLKTKSEDVVRAKVLDHCGSKALDKGSNVLGFEAIKKQIDLLLDEEVSLVKNNKLRILGIEKEEKFELETDLFEKPVKLHGKIDRIDELNGIKRIVDYKTGTTKSLNLSNFEDLILDEDKAHAFQTLFYSLLKQGIFDKDEQWQAGNIYLKEKSKKFKPLHINKDDVIDNQKLDDFKTVLHQLLEDIIDVNTGFKNKEKVS